MRNQTAEAVKGRVRTQIFCEKKRSLLVAMAMADAEGSLDYWRKFFSSAKSDIFELIEKAILVAAEDRPTEFKDRRDLIVEKLHPSQLSLRSEGGRPELQGLSNGDDIDEYNKEEKNSSNCDDPVGNDQIVGEVTRIKEVLCSHQHESDTVLYESLRSLQRMQLPLETLMATEIGRTVNALRKHSSNQIRKLVGTLIDGWKAVADQWVRSKNSAESLRMLNKSDQSDEASEMSRLEMAKRKLIEGYQRVERAKKQRMIQVIELGDPPMESHEKRRPKEKPEN